MIVIVFDTRERISLCGMTAPQFMQLAAIMRLGKRHHNSHVQAVAGELYLNSHWILDTGDPMAVQITLADLTWDQVFVLTCIVNDLLAASLPGRRRTLIEEILEGLTAAVESALRPDGASAKHPGRFGV